ncbi:MAG TPA: hypothetical protein VL688_02785 [Verrucomicrobiae bacterium]|nr:hypothetical protein [Verrucomicrobiae bacterium]
MEMTENNLPRALVLFGPGRFFESVSRFLKAEGFEVQDSLDGRGFPDIVITDLFFLCAGLAEAVRQEYGGVPVVLLTGRKESLRSCASLCEADEVLVCPGSGKFSYGEAAEALGRSRQLRLVREPAAAGTSLWDALSATYHLSLE